MNEIKIRVSSIIREVFIWLLMLAAAFLTNVYAISTYDGQWSELLSQLHIVFLLSIVYYIILALVRGIVYGFMILVKRWVLPA